MLPNISSTTHPALHIRDITDAHRVLEAVRLGILPAVKKRLAAHERSQLHSGNVFVWEESDYEDGLVRWTDGRRWSQSKMRGECLCYEEKIEMTEAEKLAKAARRAMKGGAVSSCPPKRKDRPSKIGGLIKQTYTVSVRLPGATTHKKWHLVAYSSTLDSATLPVVEDYPYLRNIRVPAGIFLNTNSGRLINGSLEKFPAPSPVPESSHYEWEHNPSAAIRQQRPLSSSSSCRTFNTGDNGITLPAISATHPHVTLPSLSSLGHLLPQGSLSEGHSLASSPPHSWSICNDDRRILDRFRIMI